MPDEDEDAFVETNALRAVTPFIREGESNNTYNIPQHIVKHIKKYPAVKYSNNNISVYCISSIFIIYYNNTLFTHPNHTPHHIGTPLHEIEMTKKKDAISFLHEETMKRSKSSIEDNSESSSREAATGIPIAAEEGSSEMSLDVCPTRTNKRMKILSSSASSTSSASISSSTSSSGPDVDATSTKKEHAQVGADHTIIGTSNTMNSNCHQDLKVPASQEQRQQVCYSVGTSMFTCPSTSSSLPMSFMDDALQSSTKSSFLKKIKDILKKNRDEDEDDQDKDEGRGGSGSGSGGGSYNELGTATTHSTSSTTTSNATDCFLGTSISYADSSKERMRRGKYHPLRSRDEKYFHDETSSMKLSWKGSDIYPMHLSLPSGGNFTSSAGASVDDVQTSGEDEEHEKKVEQVKDIFATTKKLLDVAKKPLKDEKDK